MSLLYPCWDDLVVISRTSYAGLRWKTLYFRFLYCYQFINDSNGNMYHINDSVGFLSVQSLDPAQCVRGHRLFCERLILFQWILLSHTHWQFVMVWIRSVGL
jgi:hypothetical protein